MNDLITLQFRFPGWMGSCPSYLKLIANCLFAFLWEGWAALPGPLVLGEEALSRGVRQVKGTNCLCQASWQHRSALADSAGPLPPLFAGNLPWVSSQLFRTSDWGGGGGRRKERREKRRESGVFVRRRGRRSSEEAVRSATTASTEMMFSHEQRVLLSTVSVPKSSGGGGSGSDVCPGPGQALNGWMSDSLCCDYSYQHLKEAALLASGRYVSAPLPAHQSD